MARKCIVFDLDGTLVDSLPQITAALNVFLRVHGRRAVSKPDVRRMMGDGALELVERCLAATGHVPERDETAALAEAFLALYRGFPVAACRPFDQVGETLATLREAGCRLAVCTNKERATSIKVLHHVGLAPLFDVVVGGDSTPHLKPHVAPLELALAQLDGAPETAIMVGDSGNDITMAQALNLPAVACLYGYPRDAVELAGADHAITEFAQLLEVLNRVI